MTNSVTVKERGNAGDHSYVTAEIDITSLGSAGQESFDPSTKLGLEGVQGATVLDQENAHYWFDFDADNNNILVRDRGPEMNQKSADPGSQTYSANTETTIATYDVGDAGVLDPLNFDPANPSDADLDIILRVEFHDGTTTDLFQGAGGTAQTRENLIDGFGTGDDGKAVRKAKIIVKETGGADATEDIGASTLEFYAYRADAENNEDVGTVTMRLEGDFGP